MMQFYKHRIFLSQVSGRILTNIHVKFVVDEIQKILNENSSENEIQEAEGFEIGPQEETRNRVCFKSFFSLFIFCFIFFFRVFRMLCKNLNRHCVTYSTFLLSTRKTS